MLIIEDNIDLFNSNEKEILEKKCISFVASDTPMVTQSFTNYYVREAIYNNTDEFQTIISKINDCIIKSSNKNNIKLDGFWINKITNETNKNDEFHKDLSDLTFLMYLNDNFEGGEYEYIVSDTKKKETIKQDVTKNEQNKINWHQQKNMHSILF